MKKELQSSTNHRNLSGKDGSVVDQEGSGTKGQMGRQRLSEEFCGGKIGNGKRKGESEG